MSTGFKGFVKQAHYKYSSVQYNLSDKISRRIISWGRDNIRDEDLYEDHNDSSYGREKIPHVTIFYGINNPNITSIRRLLNDKKSFKIKLGKISCFTMPDKFDVVKVDVSGESLHSLHNIIRDNLKTTEVFANYSPHITIAYVRKGTGKKYSGSRYFEGLELSVKQLEFLTNGSSSIKCKIDL